MKVVTEEEASRNLGELAENAWDDHDIVLIARPGGRSAVMLSLEHYESLNETAYLLRSPANAERLMQSISEANRGNARERELVEP